jgi:hypothetical protein
MEASLCSHSLLATLMLIKAEFQGRGATWPITSAAQLGGSRLCMMIETLLSSQISARIALLCLGKGWRAARGDSRPGNFE